MEPMRGQRVRKSKQQSCEIPTVKLRSSCDACTDSKVRCDKQHPSCTRCIKSGHQCKYSISLRTGKFASNLLAAMQMTPNDHGLGSVSNDDNNTDDSNDPQVIGCSEGFDFIYQRTPQHLSLTPTADRSDTTGTGPSGTLMAGALTPGSAVPVSVESMCNTPPGTSYLGDTRRGFPDDIMEDLLGTSPLPIPATNTNTTWLPEASLEIPMPEDLSWVWMDTTIDKPGAGKDTEVNNTINTISNNNCTDLLPFWLQSSGTSKPSAPTSTPHNCTRVAKQLLATVNRLSVRDDHRPAGLTNGQVFLVCSRVTKQLYQLLECPCKDDPHLPFLMSVIISNMLITYSNIAQVTTPPFHRPHSPKFRSAPLTLDVYEIDDEAGRLLNMQLVVHELRKMKHLDKLFLEKYCQNVDADDAGIYTALGQFINQRLRKTIEACGIPNLGCD